MALTSHPVGSTTSQPGLPHPLQVRPPQMGRGKNQVQCRQQPHWNNSLASVLGSSGTFQEDHRLWEDSGYLMLKDRQCCPPGR